MKYAKQLFVAAAWQQLLRCSATDADTDTNTRYRYTYTFHSSSSVQCICLRIVSRFLYFFGHVSVVYLSQRSSLFAASSYSFFAFLFVFDLKHKLLLFVSCFAQAKPAVLSPPVAVALSMLLLLLCFCCCLLFAAAIVLAALCSLQRIPLE